MALDYPRALGPGVREVVGDDSLEELLVDDRVALLRPSRADRALLVLHQRPPDVIDVLDEVDRLSWLDGRGPAPALVATARADEGDEAAVVRLGVDATPASTGHPLGPEAMAEALAASLRALHTLEPAPCPFDASLETLLRLATDAVQGDTVAVAPSGPYAGRSADELLRILVELTEADRSAPTGDAVFVHGALRADRVWFAPDGSVTFTGWRRSGLGDRHLDLAAAAGMVTELHGPALVAPLLDAYGLDLVDLRRLDAAQLLVHLLP